MSRKLIIVLVSTSALVLIVITVLITLHISQHLRVHEAPTLPPKTFLTFEGSHASGQLQTEEIDGTVHYKLAIVPTHIAPEEFEKLIDSKVSPFLHFDIQLQDEGGFTLCSESIAHESLNGSTTPHGTPTLEANGTFSYCEPSNYARVTKWAMTSNLGSALNVLKQLNAN